jgi:hypothetical protein
MNTVWLVPMMVKAEMALYVNVVFGEKEYRYHTLSLMYNISFGG